jgi:hypothetical protein
MDEHLTFSPFGWDLEFDSIGAHRIVVVGDVWRIGHAEGIRDISVDGDPEAEHLPVRGDRNCFPIRVIIIRPVKIHSPIHRPLDPAEFPCAIKREKVRRQKRIFTESQIYRGIGTVSWDIPAFMTRIKINENTIVFLMAKSPVFNRNWLNGL